MGITLAMRKSRSSKRRSVPDKSLRNANEPDLVSASIDALDATGDLDHVARARVYALKLPAVGAGRHRSDAGGERILWER